MSGIIAGGYSIGIAESAGLYFLRGGGHGRGRGAAGGKHIGSDELFGHYRLAVGNGFKLGGHYHFWRLGFRDFSFLLSHQFMGHAQSFRPWRHNLGGFGGREGSYGGRLQWGRRRSIDQADEVVVARRNLQQFGVGDCPG